MLRIDAFFYYFRLFIVAHLSDAPRKRLVVTGDSARIQDETAESSIWFIDVLGVFKSSALTTELCGLSDAAVWGCLYSAQTQDSVH